jgi:hypothetical protein
VRKLLTCLFITASFAAVATQAGARSGGRFGCGWNWSLAAGVRTHYVTAGNSATCGGQRASLTLSTRLQEWNPAAQEWRTVRFRRRTWTNLHGRRAVEVGRRCDGGRYRATFTWLVQTHGAVLSQLALTKGPRRAPVGCRHTRKG